MDFREDNVFDRVVTNATMVCALVVAAWEYARAISLIVYMILVGIDAFGDIWNVFIYIEVLLCLFAGFLYTTMGVPGEGLLPVTHMFTITPFLAMLTFYGLFALRYFLADTTCPQCPTYVETGTPNCHANPYAIGATLDWTTFETYNRDVIISNTLAVNPASNIRDVKILKDIERCWSIGCSECTDTYEWRHLLTIGTLVDAFVNAVLGIVLANIR